MNCEVELAEAREIVSVYREENVRLDNELTELKERMYDALDLCNILLLVENRSVKILAGLIKDRLEKKNVPVGRAEQGTNQITQLKINIK